MANIDLPAWVGIIATLFLIVAAAAGAVSIAWSKATTTRQTLLESNNKTLDERVKILEDELERERKDHRTEIEKKDLAHTSEVKELRAQTESLKDQVRALEKVVTGREQLEHLQASLDAHDRRVDQFMLTQTQNDSDAVQRHDDLKALMIANKRLLTQLLEVTKHD